MELHKLPLFYKTSHQTINKPPPVKVLFNRTCVKVVFQNFLKTNNHRTKSAKPTQDVC